MPDQLLRLGDKVVGIVTTGGPEYEISVKGKRYHFEMHPYCGPIALNKRGDELKTQPQAFLHAATQWVQQGQKVEDGLCVWYHDPEPIIEMRGRYRFIVGQKEPVRGS